MRNFFLPCRPLPRAVIGACHLFIQLAVLATGGYWLARDGLEQPWQHWAIGGGVTVMVMIAIRLLGELWMLPHYLLAQQPVTAGRGATMPPVFTPSPAMHLVPDDGTGTVRIARQQPSTVDTSLGQRQQDTAPGFGNLREAPPAPRGKERIRHEKPPRTEPTL